MEEIPRGPGWQYEAKWDGFRCLAFRDGAEVKLQSKSGQPLEVERRLLSTVDCRLSTEAPPQRTCGPASFG